MIRIKELRKERNVTQQQIADSISISRSVLSQYENELVEPTAAVIIKLSNFFNVSADYLLNRTDELGAVVSPTAPALADDERELLDLYRKMNQRQRNRFVGFGEGLLGVSSSNKLA